MEENLSLSYNQASFILSSKEIKHNFSKRAFDIVFSIAVFLLFFPVFFLIALCIRFSSRGVIIYSHERIGRGGKPFKCYKFRTMYSNADVRLKELLSCHQELCDEWNRTHKLKNDPRVTPIGKFLRMSSLDELPQFWNVLKGDMSVVGPRPVVRAELVKFFGRTTPLMLSLRPGLTGIWQVSGRSDTSYTERIRMDIDYVQLQSFFYDLWLIAKTIPAMFKTRGAY